MSVTIKGNIVDIVKPEFAEKLNDIANDLLALEWMCTDLDVICKILWEKENQESEWYIEWDEMRYTYLWKTSAKLEQRLRDNCDEILRHFRQMIKVKENELDEEGKRNER